MLKDNVHFLAKFRKNILNMFIYRIFNGNSKIMRPKKFQTQIYILRGTNEDLETRSERETALNAVTDFILLRPVHLNFCKLLQLRFFTRMAWSTFEIICNNNRIILDEKGFE